MHISFSPQRRDDALAVTKQGDTLTINGVEYDFSGITDGGTLPADAVDCAYIAGDIERIDGVLHLTLVLPHGPSPSQEVAFAAPIINPADGILELPK
jgi:hypothetical protein